MQPTYDKLVVGMHMESDMSGLKQITTEIPLYVSA